MVKRTRKNKKTQTDVKRVFIHHYFESVISNFAHSGAVWCCEISVPSPVSVRFFRSTAVAWIPSGPPSSARSQDDKERMEARERAREKRRATGRT